MKKKKWWQYLLRFPLVLLVDLMLFILALFLDGAWVNDSSSIGHGVPVFTLLAIPAIFVITIVSLVKIVVGIIKSLKKDDRLSKERLNDNFAPIKAFIPFAISVIISIILITVSFNNEINNFYQDVNHIGFPIPITSFFLIIVFIIINIVVLIICFITAKRRR